MRPAVQQTVIPAGPAWVTDVSSYNEFADRLRGYDCRRCGLADGRTRLVVDRGRAEAGVMLIGEAPGREEDLSGRPFVGRAGRLLDSLFAEAGFLTDRDALVANIVKCRPPGNRPPKDGEADCCRLFLQRQIALAAPRLMALLGATALKRMLPDKEGVPMADLAGTFIESAEYPACRIMVFFHPAYLLRDPRKLPLMREHIRRFVEAWRASA